MRKIVHIYGTEERISKAGDAYKVTTVLTDVGDEAQYFGDDIEEGDLVEVFLHYGKIKCRKKP